jgi:hypothetical protein
MQPQRARKIMAILHALIDPLRQLYYCMRFEAAICFARYQGPRPIGPKMRLRADPALRKAYNDLKTAWDGRPMDHTVQPRAISSSRTRLAAVRLAVRRTSGRLRMSWGLTPATDMDHPDVGSVGFEKIIS